jgi:acyl-CoA synthetase (AMP-forming)/AMP-acid ligase II
MVPPGPEFFALTFALLKIGAVPVLVDPGMGLRRVGRCLVDARPVAFVGVPRAHLARLLFRWSPATLRVLVTVGRLRAWGGSRVRVVAASGGNHGRNGATRPAGARSFAAYPVAAVGADEEAAILFTSGSTGPAKGAVYAHGMLAAQRETLRATFDIKEGEIDLCTFPLFALYAPALGMTSIVPAADTTRPARVDPHRIVDPILRFGVTNLFASPALLRRLAPAGGAPPAPLPSLRRVVSAGAPVPAIVVERFRGRLSPGVQVFTPYGATEALPITSIGSDEILGETCRLTDEGAGLCVGRPVEGIEVRVIRISDDPIPAWSGDLIVPREEIGEIVVRGPTVTRAYVNRPDADARGKIRDVSGALWHRTGDTGYLCERGRLWFCGRLSQRVVTRQGTLHTIPCEAVFDTHPLVRRTALVGVGPRGAQRPVLCIEVEPGTPRSRRATLLRELAALAESRPLTRGIATFLIHPGFPVDVRHNAKIVRETLADWAARRLA